MRVIAIVSVFFLVGCGQIERPAQAGPSAESAGREVADSIGDRAGYYCVMAENGKHACFYYPPPYHCPIIAGGVPTKNCFGGN